MTKVLDGVAIAAAIKQEVAEEVRKLAAQGIRPGLAAVLVGNMAASEIYVRSKVQTCADLGLYSELITPPDTVTTEEMLDLVNALNTRDEIDGILIQLPLPKQVDAKALLDAVSPAKDVDGFHPVNAGRLQAGRPALAPCTPAGVIEILKRSGIPIAGQHAVVVGRSDIVGKPVGDAAAARECHGHHLPLEDARSRSRYAAGGHSGGGDWATRIHYPGDGEAGRDHHRCGHQPDHRRG